MPLWPGGGVIPGNRAGRGNGAALNGISDFVLLSVMSVPCCAKVAFARGIQQLPDDLMSQRPTKMFAVPRVFERFAARIRDGVAGSAWQRRLLERCVVAGGRVEAEDVVR